MLTRHESLLFNRELVFLMQQFSSCSDLTIKKGIYAQINLLLQVLDKKY
jgi:hypothetical protein